MYLLHQYNKYIILSIVFSIVFCNTRVAFSRPSTFIRTPSQVVGSDINQFYVGASTEVINTDNLNNSSSIYFYSSTLNGFDYGLNYITHAQRDIADVEPPSALIFNFTKEIYRYNNLIINLGVHDIVLDSNISDSKPSLFLSFINSQLKIGKDYFISIGAGVGSEKLNFDSHDIVKEKANRANLFCGIELETPWAIGMSQNKISLALEYIDDGLHFGCRLPMKNIAMKIGVTHLENISEYNDYKIDNTEEIFGNDAGIAFSIQYQIPTRNNQLNIKEPLDKVSISEPENNCFIGLDSKNHYSPLKINNECTVSSIKKIVEEVNNSFHYIQDSIIILNQDLKSHKLNSHSLEYKIVSLEDSLQISLLNNKISKTELNIAIKSLTNSLKYYYTNEYHLALKEIDKTIKYLPNLAVAYARRGSIYYKLLDFDRATVNWNYALQLDPEYEEVQKILLNMKENNIQYNDRIDLPE